MPLDRSPFLDLKSLNGRVPQIGEVLETMLYLDPREGRATAG